MTTRVARIIAALYLLAFAAAVTWPGMTLFNRVEPKVLGLPFNMVWISFWLILAIVVLLMVDIVERKGGRR